MEILTLLFVLLAASYISGELCRKVRLPRVLGPLAVGLVIGIPVLRDGLISVKNSELLSSFSDLGLIFLMFYVGLELDLRSMMQNARRGIFVSLFNILVPFLITLLVMKLLGFGFLVAIITGLIVCVTAEAMSIEILSELNLLKSKIGETIVIAATLDDVVEVVFLAGLVGYIEKTQSPNEGFIFIVFNVLVFMTVIYAARFLLLPYLLRFLNKDKSGSQLFIIGVLMVLLVSIVAAYLRFGELIGAFLAGIVVKYTLLDAHEYREQREMKEIFEAATFGFLAPFFFIWIGMETDIASVIRAPALGLILTALAFGTKIVGSVIGNYVGHGTLREGIAIGVATTNKGIVEVVAAEIARAAGIITPEFFSAVIFMAIATTVLSPILFNALVRRISTS